MYEGNRILGLVTARAGSKRLINKNKKLVNGRSLVERAIGGALSSKYVDRVVVSTDDEEIASKARSRGADVPFSRPVELGRDTTSSVSVVLHALDELERKNEIFTYIILLQPTSPLRTATHIDECIKFFFLKSAVAVVSICKVSHPLAWAFTLDNNSTMFPYFDSYDDAKRSQEFETNYIPNGALYITGVDEVKRTKTFFPEKGLYGFEMKKSESLDIDDQEDIEIANAVAIFKEGWLRK